jgi:hypothetical protein
MNSESKEMEKLYSGTHTARWAHKKIVNQADEIQELEKENENLKALHKRRVEEVKGINAKLRELLTKGDR